MIQVFRRTLPIFLLLGTAGAQAQYYKLHGGSVSVGGTGQFNTELTSSQTSGTYNVPFGSGATTYSTSVSGQQQFTTDSVGFVSSLQLYPTSWAGVEFNYGYAHYSERFAFNYATPIQAQRINVPTTAHEVTAAYMFHAKHIRFQPFVNIGGGAIDFLPASNSNQWRWAGLLEAGFEVPTRSPHLALRAEGRGLFYRAPNYNQPAISTRMWRVTEEPSASVVFKF